MDEEGIVWLIFWLLLNAYGLVGLIWGLGFGYLIGRKMHK